MVNDDPLTPKAKQAYRQAARVLLETVLTQRLRRSGDTTGLNSEWLEEKALPIYHVLVINRLYGDSSHRFLSDLYLHHTPDSVPKGRVYTQLTLGFVDNAQGWHLDYTFAFRPTDTTTTYHTQRWRQWFHYCEDNGAQPLEVLDSADIPTLLVAERRALSARELRASANQ